MAVVPSTVITFQAPDGVGTSRRAEVGPGVVDIRAEGRLPRVGQVRAWLQPSTGPAAVDASAALELPDSGVRIAGIRVPFVMPIELPIIVDVSLLSALPAGTQLRCVVSASELSGCEGRYGALSESATLAVGAVLPLDPYVQAVSVLTAAGAADLLDVGGLVIERVTGLDNPKPRRAVSARVALAPSVLIAHYTS